MSVLRVVAAVLHLGNITFTPGERTKGTNFQRVGFFAHYGEIVSNVDTLNAAAKLFGVESSALNKALTHRGFQGGNNKAVRRKKKNQQRN